MGPKMDLCGTPSTFQGLDSTSTSRSQVKPAVLNLSYQMFYSIKYLRWIHSTLLLFIKQIIVIYYILFIYQFNTVTVGVFSSYHTIDDVKP